MLHKSPPIQINKQFKETMYEIEHGLDHLLITGYAGTGKSTLLELFRKTTQKKLVVLAPTGVAALHVKGQTVHSFFGIPPRLVRSSDLEIKKYRTKLYKSIEILVIDEVSMLRADILDHIDHLLRAHRRSNTLFGGVKLVFIGDLYQLPPVVSTNEASYFFQHYQTPYFFSAKCMQGIVNFQIIELKKIFRQEDPVFIRLLQQIRFNAMESDDFSTINSRCIITENSLPENTITLTATNAAAEAINKIQLDSLSHESYVYQGKLQGEFSAQLAPVDQALVLKKGAQVMLLRNDPDGLYANGSIGIVQSCSEDEVTVLLENEKQEVEEAKVSKHTWEMIRYQYSENTEGELKYEVVGTYSQMPLKLAWAITIHKSQGKTFDRIQVDMGRGAFEFGQTYVALSRCRSMEGIILKKPIRPSDIQTDERIIDFLRRYM